MSVLGMNPARFAGLDDVQRVEAEWRAASPDLLADSPFHQLQRAAARDSGRLAIRFVPDGAGRDPPRDVSFGQFHALLFAAANVLHAQGARPDRAIAYLLTNTPEALALIWGGTAAGIVAPINHYLEPELLGSMLERMQADILVTDAQPAGVLLWEKIVAAVTRARCVRKILHVSETQSPRIEGVDIVRWDETRLSVAQDRLSSDRQIRGHQIAAYFHTGGTTGRPKFAQQTHGAQALAAKVAGFAMGIDASHRLIAGMPIFHAGGLMGCGLVPLAHGASIVQPTVLGYRGEGVISGLWRFCARHSVTMLVGPPTLYARLSDLPRDALEHNPVRCAISSAAALPEAIHRRFECYSKLPLREVYGLTEATLLVAGTPYDAPTQVGSVGVRLPFVELGAFELDDSSRKPTPTGKPGMIAVRSPMVMPGYLGEDRASFPSDDWFDTGDVGYMDEQGYVYITGRAKDIIIRGGHNIDPSIIEDALRLHPDVADCAAVGMPDEDVGEIPIAYVTLHQNATVRLEELLRFARASIQERAAVPKKVVFLNQLPLTPVGKVSKVELRRDAVRLAATSALQVLLNAGRLRSVGVVQSETSDACVVVESVDDAPSLQSEVLARLGPLNLKWKLVTFGNTG